MIREADVRKLRAIHVPGPSVLSLQARAREWMGHTAAIFACGEAGAVRDPPGGVAAWLKFPLAPVPGP